MYRWKDIEKHYIFYEKQILKNLNTKKKNEDEKKWTFYLVVLRLSFLVQRIFEPSWFWICNYFCHIYFTFLIIALEKCLVDPEKPCFLSLTRDLWNLVLLSQIIFDLVNSNWDEWKRYVCFPNDKNWLWKVKAKQFLNLIFKSKIFQ